ncbi:exodeoxyribonuclease VII small subunit [Endozoicomonadaceae bacterium StTr2]
MTAKKQASGEFSFEKSLSDLEQIVNQMESGQLTLEQSLAAFEKGVRLTRECQTALDQAEQKVQLLLEKDGQTELHPFEPES